VAKTSLEKIWEEYLTLEPEDKADFLLQSSVTLKHQGQVQAQRALLYQAVEDALSVGDVRVAATAAVDLSSTFETVEEICEAKKVLLETIERIPPWCSFELGLCYRALALVEDTAEDDNGGEYLSHLQLAIAQFEASGLEEWSFPLTNKIGQYYLKTQEWELLQALLGQKAEPSEGSVAPIVIAIRKYLWSRLHERNLDYVQAAEQLAECTAFFMHVEHELYEEAMDSFAHALSRIGLTPKEFFSKRPQLALGLQGELMLELEERAASDSTLY
jgi:hypothetical protein